MPFIDWNGDGKIDPVDIGISIATEADDDEESGAPMPEVKRKSGGGCLTAMASLVKCAGRLQVSRIRIIHLARRDCTSVMS